MKLKMGNKQTILTFLLILSVFLSSLGFIFAEAEENRGLFKENVIKVADIIVTQAGNTLSNIDPIDAKKSFQISLKPIIPFDKNGGEGKLGPGDSTTLKICEGISATKEAVFKFQPDGSDKEGLTITFRNDGNAVFADFQLSSDEEVFKNVSEEGFKNVTLGMDYTVNIDKIQQNNPLNEIVILDKHYSLSNVKPAVSIKKTGRVDYNAHSIVWEARVSSDNSLAGYTFFDDLTPVLSSDLSDTLRNNKITVKDTSTGSDILNGTFSYTDKKINYIFPAGAPKEAIITFQTELSWDEFKNGFPKKTNKALIKKDNEEIDISSAEVYMIADWGEKTVENPVEKENYYYVTWKIEFNGFYNDNGKIKGRELDAVEIKDEMPSDKGGSKKLIFDSAKLEVFGQNGERKTEITYTTKPSNSVYKISDAISGKFNDKAVLTIVSKIAKSEALYRTEFSNTAEIYWNYDSAAKISFNKEIALSKNNEGLTKDIVNKYKYISEGEEKDFAPADVTWKIGVKNGIVNENTYFYDVFLSGFYLDNKGKDLLTWGLFNGKDGDITKFSVKDSNGKKTLTSGISVQSVLPSSERRNVYMGAFTDNSGLGLKDKVYDLLYENKVVGKVLEVSGFKHDSSKNNDYKYEFTFKSKFIDPTRIINKKKENSEEIKIEENTNKAYIIEKTGSGHIVHPPATSWPKYKSNMIKKGVIPSANAQKIMNNTYELGDINQDPKEEFYDKNNNAVKDAFSFKERSVLYRVSLNASGLSNFAEFNEMYFEDEFPNGWDIADINNSNKYLVYEGKQLPNEDTTDYVEAIDSPLSKQEIESLFKPKMEGKKLTFNLSNINKPYVVLLRLKISDDHNEKGLITNIGKIKMKLKGNADNYTKSEESRINVQYDARFLSKENLSTDIDTNNQIKMLKWRIEFNPNLMPDSIKAKLANANAIELVDTLGDGLEVLADKDGNPVFDGNSYVLTEIENGNQTVYKKDKDLKAKVFYDKTKRELVLKRISANSNKVYILDYTTRIVKSEIKNTLALKYENTTLAQQDKYEYDIKYWASVEWAYKETTELKIHKVNESGKPLEGVEFTLTDNNGKVNKKIKIGSDGYKEVKDLPAGTYRLTEISTNKDYNLPENPNYDFEIIKADKVFTIREINENSNIKIVSNDTQLGYEIEVTNQKKPSIPKQPQTPLTKPNQPPVTPPNTTPQTPPSTPPAPPSTPSVPPTPPSTPSVPPVTPDRPLDTPPIPPVTPPTTPTTPPPTTPVTPPTTPTTPITPEAPEVPEIPETPDTPVTPPVTPTEDLPVYPVNSFPDPNDPDSPDEFVAIGEDGTPLGRYVKRETPDGEMEYVIAEDLTPKGAIKAKLPKTGKGDEKAYYIFGSISLLLAVTLLIKKKR